MLDLWVRQTSLSSTVISDCLEDGLGLDLTPDTLESHFAIKMRNERERHRTFGCSWPSVWSKQLASYGFYSISQDTQREHGVREKNVTGYIGGCVTAQNYVSDKAYQYVREKSVRCAFCGLELSGMTSAKEARLKHWVAARSYCPFLKGEDVGNVAAEEGKKSELRPGVNHEKVISRTERVKQVERFTQEKRVNQGQRAYHVGAVPPNFSITNNDCVFVRGFASPLHSAVTSQTHHEQPVTSQKPESYCQISRHNGQQHTTMAWADLVRTSRHPQMASFQSRLTSLRTWPLVKPTPAELARAGLFHVNCHDVTSVRHDNDVTCVPHYNDVRECSDSVMCFWCGERLHRWRESDDALLEHARLSPRCRYVTQILGRQLHDDIIKAGTVYHP